MYRPHDLLRVDPRGLISAEPVPAWVVDALRCYPWAAVRRAACPVPGKLAVGIRGPSRGQRFAMQLHPGAIIERLPPSFLLNRIHDGLRRSPLPSLAVLPALASLLTDWQWGVGGSVGFHLATGAPCVNRDSDLDILLYPARLLHRHQAAQLLQNIRSLAENTDVLLETPQGAFALAEYARSGATLLCRTPHGPVMCEHPEKATMQNASSIADSDLQRVSR